MVLQRAQLGGARGPQAQPSTGHLDSSSEPSFHCFCFLNVNDLPEHEHWPEARSHSPCCQGLYQMELSPRVVSGIQPQGGAAPESVLSPYQDASSHRQHNGK